MEVKSEYKDLDSMQIGVEAGADLADTTGVAQDQPSPRRPAMTFQPAVVADVYFVDFPSNPNYAFVISAAPVVQYSAPIGPEPCPYSVCRNCGSDVDFEGAVAIPVDYCGWCRG